MARREIKNLVTKKGKPATLIAEAPRSRTRDAAIHPPALRTQADDRSAKAGANAFRRATELYRRAFRLGDVAAGFNLGCTYQNVGEYRAAVKWFRRALAAGDLGALQPLARAELYGLGTRRNVGAAIAKLTRIARYRRAPLWLSVSERVEAMLVLADALSSGWPVRRNNPEAVRWWRRAAALGSHAAQGKLDDL
jgi:TPR repeat protein